MPTDERELQLDLVAAHWQWSLDAEARALDAGSSLLGSSRLACERRGLAEERQKALTLLRRDAVMRGIEPLPWLSPRQITPELLGLPAGTKACVFDLDGVLTDSGALHAAVWAETFDPLLLEVAQASGRAFVPFDPVDEYRAYLDGRSRQEGIELFLTARGLRLARGREGDAGGSSTVAALARRKGELLERALRSHRLAAL